LELELGKEISEEELLEMIYEADPNGHGYISYEAF
jgi:Ca2+-binding EF-hand superfamily protein